MIPPQVNKLLLRKTLIPILEPLQGADDGCILAFKTAPAKIEQVATPHTCIRSLDRRHNQFVMLNSVTTIAKQMEVRNEGQATHINFGRPNLNHSQRNSLE